MALGLQSPWEVTEITFSGDESGQRELHLHIDFVRGSRFPDETGVACPVHDTVAREWQHLNFFEHHCFLHFGVPRIKTTDGKVVTVNVPWARPDSGFTLMFEAFAMALIEREMPVNRVAEILGVYPQRVWTVFNHWLEKARKADDPSAITRLWVDETSSRKGHKNVTLGVDLETTRVIHVCEGKGKGVPKIQITQLSMDLPPAFIAGAAESFPSAKITVDRFHVVKLLNEAMDKVRRAERLEHDELTGHKYTFLRNRQNLSEKKEKALSEMIELYPTLGTAYRLKVLFNDLWEMPGKEAQSRAWPTGVMMSKRPKFRHLWLSPKPSERIGRASFTSSKHALQMEYWKALIAKYSLQKDAPEASVISRISST